MYVHVYVYTRVYTYVYMYIYTCYIATGGKDESASIFHVIYLCIYVYVYAYVHIYTCIYTHVCVYIYVYTYIFMFIPRVGGKHESASTIYVIYICTYVHVYVYMYTYMYTYNISMCSISVCIHKYTSISQLIHTTSWGKYEGTSVLHVRARTASSTRTPSHIRKHKV